MERTELTTWGPMAGMVGAVSFSVLWGLAILSDGHWLFGVETLSELGGLRPGRCYFNAGVMTMGILAIPFGMALFYRLRQDLVGRLATLMFILASVFLIGVGAFPINTGTPHTFFSWAFFCTVILSLTMMLLPFRRDDKLRREGLITTAGVVLIGYVTIGLVAASLMELALSEALVVIALNIWVIVTGASSLRNWS